MTKSKIIKDIATGNITIESALKRLKILLLELNKESINEWVDFELIGYPDKKNIPEYRKSYGQVYGTFFVKAMKYSNVPIPIVDEKLRELLSRVELIDGIANIELMIDMEKEYSINIPPEQYPYLMNGTQITSIINATTLIPPTAARNIVSTVENRVINILYLLEQEFGSLDDLDIDTTTRSNEEISYVVKKIYNIIYIGDNNKISKSEIGK